MSVVPSQHRISAGACPRRLAAAAGLVALVVVASACGGSGGSSSTPSTPAVRSTSEVAEPSASPKEGLDFSMKDPKGGYIIHYPASWNEHMDLAGISLTAPLKVGLAGFHYNGDKTDSLQELAKKAPAVEKTTISKFHLTGTSPAQIDGEKAVQFTYTGQNANKVDLKAFSAWMIFNGRAYRFSFAASASYYNQLYPSAQAIMHSIHFTSR